MKIVAIATLVSHPALDSLQENIKSELARQGFIEGKTIRYEIRNASGQMQLLSGIAKELVGTNPDVSVAITTPVAQAMAKVTRGPFVFSAVTDPVGAGIVKSLDSPEKLITGATDAWPYNDQLKLIHDIAPTAKRIVVIFNPGEAASQYGMKYIRQFAPQYGFELVEGAVNSTNEVYAVAANLSSTADAIFLSSDSTAISGVAGAARVAIKRQIPLFVGDSGTVEKGGVAAASIGYDKLGVETGKLVARVLRGEQNIPIVLPDGKSDIVVNTKAAQLMGIEIPTSVLSRAKVIGTISP
jgi:putative ABC transport system substrate-binding protein